jgi:predicted RNase H-like HicB family nuclease
MLGGNFARTPAAARRYRHDMTEEKSRYVVSLHRIPGGFFAQVVDIPGCFSRGDSEVEALENARAMIRAYVAIARRLSREAPTLRLEITA